MTLYTNKQAIKPLIVANRLTADIDYNELYFEKPLSEDWIQIETFEEYKLLRYFTNNKDLLLKLIAGNYAFDLSIKENNYSFTVLEKY